MSTPTLCFADNLTPVNVCRVCVVEVEGARVLVPACSRKAEPGMVVATDSERVRLSRKLVLEFLASSVDVSTAPAFPGYLDALRRGARALRPGPARQRPPRRGPRRPPPRARRGRRRDRRSSRSRSTTTSTSATTASASSATSASRPAAPTRRTPSPSPSPAAASTRASRPSSTSRCPTRPASTAATASASARPARSCSRPSTTCAQAGTWDEPQADRDDDHLPLLRRRLHPRPARPGRPHRQGDVPARLDRHRGPPLHQGPLRLAVRPRRPRRLIVTFDRVERWRPVQVDARPTLAGRGSAGSWPG